MTSTPQRFGQVAIVGLPNAGKSTLVNALVGVKVSIVSAKPQTTRSRITGITHVDGTQMVLLDTPGIFDKPVGALGKAMHLSILESLGAIDAVVLVLDAASPPNKRATSLRRLENVLTEAGGGSKKLPLLLVLSKVDTIPKKDAMEVLQWAATACPEAHSYYATAAVRGHGVADLGKTLAGLMPEGPWAYDPEQTSTLPLQLLAAEMTREEVFRRLHQEIPYSLTVVPEAWEEGRHAATIRQQILVQRDSHKAMVIGKGGQMLKAISMAARTAIAELTGRPVHLFLHVKVAPGWEGDKRLGEN
jgi:GTP-binding protein Era